ncbi:MAG: S8 family peptidase [Muribaculaceae bacterium]|nr:S8 family peptidase [Muribaculaceae bacterium]
MKKIFIGALCFAASLTMFADGAKISPAGRMLMMEHELNPTRGAEMINALVKMAAGYTVEDLEGYPVLATFGEDMAIVELSLDEVELLSGKESVERISFGEMATPCLDIARKDTGVDQVQAGTGLSAAFNGKGVVAGIFDTGLDPNHINFCDAQGNSRVKRFYIPDTNKLYTEENMSAATTDNSKKTHGTHCAGIMGGAYNGTGKIVGTKSVFGRPQPAIVTGNVPYYGVAREADLYLSGSQLSNANILLACQKIADYAKEQGKPAVINLSLGSVSGSHDGTGDFCLALDKVAESGALIFIAAGNSGDVNMSLKKTLTSADKSIKTFATQVAGNMVEFWANNNGVITGKFAVYDKTSGQVNIIREVNSSKTQSVTIAGSGYTSPSYEHNIYFDNAFNSSSYVVIESGVRSANNRSYVTFTVSLSTTGNLIPLFIVDGNAGQTLLATVNAGQMTNFGLAGYDNGTNLENINEMATASKAIAIGSYNTRLSWGVFGNNSPTTIAYNDYSEKDLGYVSDFSSFGTTFDGQSLPHVCAPGMGIISSYSTPFMDSGSAEAKAEAQYVCATADANGRNNYWLCEQGTSMATPFAAGTVALWLQIKPTLTRSEVIQLFNKTSVRDNCVLAGNPVQWGAGKLSAINGAKQLLGIDGVGTVYEDEDLRLIITNETGKMFNITVGGESGYTARLYSLSGAMVKSAVSSSSEMDLDASDLNKGVYILEIVGETAHFTKKVTVK